MKNKQNKKKNISPAKPTMRQKMKNTAMNFKKEIIKKALVALLVLGIMFPAGTQAQNFPTSLNNFQDGDLIEARDWNALETTIGVTNSAVTTSHDYRIRQLELGGGGGGSPFPFTSYSWGNGTSTVIGFLNGLFSNASSTFSGAFRLPSLSNGGLAVFGGLVSTGATTTAGTGLTYSGNAFNVNTSQNIATLSNLTSNGFVKTGSGNGTLSIDTTTYETGLTAGDGLTRTSNDFDCDTASGSSFGCLTSSDWTTFNNKQSSGNYITALTGDITASGPGSVAATLATVNGNVGSFTNANITVNAKGLITSASSGSGTAASSTLLGDTNTWSGVNRFAFASSTYHSFGTASSTLWIGGGLQECNATTGKLNWDSTTFQFKCNTDQTGAGGGITTLGSGYASTTETTVTLSTTTQSFNGLTIGQRIIPSAGALTFTPLITGTLDNTGLTNSTISGIALGSNLADLTATNSTLTFSGAYNGGTARTVGLNLGNANVWTAKQDLFGSASSTLLSSNWLKVGGTASTTLTVDGHIYSEGTATSTFAGRLSVGTTTQDSLNSATFTVKSLMDKVAQFFTSAGVKVLEITDAGVVSVVNATKFLIPFASDPTVDTQGQLAVDTNTASSSLKFHDGTAERVIYDTDEKSFFLSTSTLSTMGGLVGTSTVEMAKAYRPQTLVAVSCTSTTTGTAFLDFGDGVNWTNLITCNSTGAWTTITTNNTFVMGEMIKFRIGTQASIDQGYTISRVIRYTP